MPIYFNSIYRLWMKQKVGKVKLSGLYYKVILRYVIVTIMLHG